jgi:hypothetical protein
LSKRSDTGPYFGIVSGECGQEHDAPHPLGVLRARRERPRDRAAKHDDEFSPSDMDCHMTLPWGHAHVMADIITL